MAKHHIEATVNGDAVEFLCETEETLLDVLRDTLNLTGSKEGCASGDCGACSVMLDGRLVCSCLVLGCEISGRKVETIEVSACGVTATTRSDPMSVSRRSHASSGSRSNDGGNTTGFCAIARPAAASQTPAATIATPVQRIT